MSMASTFYKNKTDRNCVQTLQHSGPLFSASLCILSIFTVHYAVLLVFILFSILLLIINILLF